MSTGITHRLLVAIVTTAGSLSAWPDLGRAAGDGLGALLGAIEAQKPPAQGTVELFGWIERYDDGPVLRVSLTPKGTAKLVADPGIVVKPLARDGIDWRDRQPVERAIAGQSYFDVPQTVELRFDREDGLPVAARVEYAYCLVDEICLFGEETVSADTRRPASN